MLRSAQNAHKEQQSLAHCRIYRTFLQHFRTSLSQEKNLELFFFARKGGHLNSPNHGRVCGHRCDLLELPMVTEAGWVCVHRRTDDGDGYRRAPVEPPWHHSESTPWWQIAFSPWYERAPMDGSCEVASVEKLARRSYCSLRSCCHASATTQNAGTAVATSAAEYASHPAERPHQPSDAGSVALTDSMTSLAPGPLPPPASNQTQTTIKRIPFPRKTLQSGF